MRTENHAECVEHALALLSSDTMKPVTLNRRRALQGMLLGAAGMALSLETYGQIIMAPGEVRLIFNENPYGPSPKALAEVAKILPLTAYYPDDIEGELIDLFMERLRLDRDQLFLASGSNEGLQAAMLAFGKQGKILSPRRQDLALLAEGQHGGLQPLVRSRSQKELVPIQSKSLHKQVDQFAFNIIRVISGQRQNFSHLCERFGAWAVGILVKD